MKTKFLLLLIVLESSLISAQQYVLNPVAEKWDFKPSLFYIEKVIDNRADKKNAGTALLNGKTVPVIFKKSLESDMLEYINNCMYRDTTATPLVLYFDKFEMKETGTISNHKAAFSFSIKIYRITSDRQFQLYETSGNPFLTMKGPFPNPHEKNISAALKNTLSSFNDWINKNADIPQLVNSVKVTLQPPLKFTDPEMEDTICWNKDYRLKWSDFKGKEKDISFMAESNCIFTYKAVPEIKDKTLNLSMTISACFDKLSSWVKKDQQKPELLGHEQLHFDICEAHIRSLRKKIQNYTFDIVDYDKQLQALFNEVWNEYQKEQQLYDEETQHGIIKEKQEAWTKKITERLNTEN